MRFTKYFLASFIFLFSSNIFAAHPEYSLPNDQWRIITLPAQPPANSNTVGAIFGDDFTKAGFAKATYLKQWILYAYTPEGYKKLGYDDTLEQGRGYWIIQQTGKNIPLKMPNDSIDTPNTYSLELNPSTGNTQWNLSGNPFPTPKNLGGFALKTDTGTCSSQTCDLDKSKAENLLHNQVWIYNGNTYVKRVKGDTVGAWEGFWAATLEGSQNERLRLSYTLLEKPEYSDNGGIPELSKDWFGSLGDHPVEMLSMIHPRDAEILDGARMSLARYPKRHAVEGNPPFYENIFDKINLTVDMYYPADAAGPRPTVFYISGWHNYHSEQVYSLLYFIASHGYNAVHIPYKDSEIHGLTKMVDDLSGAFKNKINTNKIGIMGYSMGGGAIFYLARDLNKKDWGKDGLFLFPIAGAKTHGLENGDIDIPAKTKMITLTYNEEENNRGTIPWDTDPRYSIDYLKRSTSIVETDKTYLYLPGDNNHVSDHATHKSFYNFKTGKFTYDALQQVGIFRPLKSLMEYTFNNNTEWKHIGLPSDGKTDMRALNGIQFYSGDNPCVDLEDKPIKPTGSYKWKFGGANPCNY